MYKKSHVLKITCINNPTVFRAALNKFAFECSFSGVYVSLPRAELVFSDLFNRDCFNRRRANWV